MCKIHRSDRKWGCCSATWVSGTEAAEGDEREGGGGGCVDAEDSAWLPPTSQLPDPPGRHATQCRRHTERWVWVVCVLGGCGGLHVMWVWWVIC